MSIVDVQINQRDTEGWIILHPETKAKNVITRDGSDVENELKTFTKNNDPTRKTDNKTTTGAINELKETSDTLKKNIDTKANKTTTYTKKEVENIIENLIGSAPEALDTLVEIAKALNNDPDFSSTIIKELGKKQDKELGLGLSESNYTNVEKIKLKDIDANSNNYIHPEKHEANIIEESDSRQFISADEKKKWNNTSIKEHEHKNKLVIDDITKTFIDNWNKAFSHGLNEDRHFTNEEREKLDNIENSANNYVHPFGTNPHGTTKRDIGLEYIDNIQQATKSEFNEHNKDTSKHISNTERNLWNSKATGNHNHKISNISDFPELISDFSDIDNTLHYKGNKIEIDEERLSKIEDDISFILDKINE